MAYDKIVDSSALDSTFSNIANAIRAKTGASNTMTPTQMLAAIADIQMGGGNDESFRTVIEGTAVNPTLPSNLTSIGNHAFYSCTSLALTSLPAGITSIGNNAFYNCYMLALTSLPAKLTNISNNAFCLCTGLQSITFNGKPNSIATNAFEACTNLTTINVPWAQGTVSGAPWGATNATINYNYTGA